MQLTDLALTASLRIIAHEIKTNHPDCDLEQRVSTLNRAAARLEALVSERDALKEAARNLLPTIPMTAIQAIPSLDRAIDALMEAIRGATP